VTAGTRTFEPDASYLARVATFAQELFGGRLGAPIRTTTCLYTLTPDRDFVIDALPAQPEVLVALGAAHGFKFASLIGRIVADLAIDGSAEPGVDLAPFRIGRPALTAADAPRHFLV
jgi:sarcosine oxidase